jgi:hypothetical protein
MYGCQPHARDCEFTQWNADLFCKLALNKAIAIMGDSLKMEQFSAFDHTVGMTRFG